MQLREWTQHYIKFQDCMKKQIRTLTETESGFIVEEKKGKKKYIVQEVLALDPSMKDKTFVVTLNTKENIAHLKQHWDEVASNQQLTIYFVNPNTNEKWHVQPYFHSKITEDIPKSLDVLFTSITEQ